MCNVFLQSDYETSYISVFQQQDIDSFLRNQNPSRLKMLAIHATNYRYSLVGITNINVHSVMQLRVL